MAGNKYSELTEKRILDTAKKLFLEKGYENVTLQGIAVACGLTRGAIYHHFKGKEEVMDAVTTYMFNEMTIDQEIKADVSLNGLEKLQKIFITSISNEEFIQMYMLLSQNFYKSPKLVSAYLQDCQRSVIPMIKFYIDVGILDGSIRVTDTEVTDSEVLAELVTIFSDIWLSPMLFKTTAEKFMLKVKYIRVMLESIGFQLLNDDVIAAIEKAAVILYKKE